MENNNNLNLGLCMGRHPMPVEGHVFAHELQAEMLVNPNGLQALASENLQAMGVNAQSRVTLYLSGLSVAQHATVLALYSLGAGVTLAHYNPTNGEWVMQPLTVACAWCGNHHAPNAGWHCPVCGGN